MMPRIRGRVQADRFPNHKGSRHGYGAIENGSKKAMRHVGFCYFRGMGGLEKDVVTALSWFFKAAELGDDYAMYNLGRSYARGDGVEKNLTTAAERLEQHARAQALDSERRDVAAGPALGDHHRELGRHRQPLAPGPAADRQEHARAELGPLDPLAARDHPTDPLRARPLGGQGIATSDLQAIHRRDRADQDLDQQLARARLGLWQLDELEHLERMARVVDVDGPQEG